MFLDIVWDCFWDVSLIVQRLCIGFVLKLSGVCSVVVSVVSFGCFDLSDVFRGFA